MSNPYGDWATETPTSDPSPRNHDHGFDQNTNPQSSQSSDGNSYGNQSSGGQSYGNQNSGGNSYGGNGGGNSYGGGGGRPPLDIPIPGRYVPISVHLGKDIPADKVELLRMMLKSMQDEKFTVRVAVNNDACNIVRDYLGNASGEPMKVEYVRPWKKFEVESFAAGDDGWYPTIPVTKSCEVLIPALGNKDDKARSFKVLEGALVMGRAAKQTARVLITYSPDGMTSHTRAGKDSAFMQNIVRFSQMFGVTVINLGASDARQRYGTFLNQFNTETKSHGQ